VSNDPIICGHCSSHNIRFIDAELKCDMCGWRKYLPLGSLSRRPFKLQVRYKGPEKRESLSVGINDNNNEPNRVMRYQVYCPVCMEPTEQGVRVPIKEKKYFVKEIKMTCDNQHVTVLIESGKTGELDRWR